MMAFIDNGYWVWWESRYIFSTWVHVAHRKVSSWMWSLIISWVFIQSNLKVGFLRDKKRIEEKRRGEYGNKCGYSVRKNLSSLFKLSL